VYDNSSTRTVTHSSSLAPTHPTYVFVVLRRRNHRQLRDNVILQRRARMLVLSAVVRNRRRQVRLKTWLLFNLHMQE
jgi:hypothetical protein